jgi:hypothetical protein
MITGKKLTLDARVQRITTTLDLSATTANLIFVDPSRDIIIQKISAAVQEAAAATHLINVGTVADPDAIVDDFAIGATNASTIGNILSVTMTSTPYRLPANTALKASCGSTAQAGIVTLVIEYVTDDQANVPADLG